MKSGKRGKPTSAVELSNVSPHGIWLLLDDKELFLSFKDFPWFADATINQLASIKLPSPGHFFWPELDIDISLDSIEHPKRYPLVSRLPVLKSINPVNTVSRVAEK
jgi:hypothetical protein